MMKEQNHQSINLLPLFQKTIEGSSWSTRFILSKQEVSVRFLDLRGGFQPSLQVEGPSSSQSQGCNQSMYLQRLQLHDSEQFYAQGTVWCVVAIPLSTKLKRKFANDKTNIPCNSEQ
jgi:hypothetical protein